MEHNPRHGNGPEHGRREQTADLCDGGEYYTLQAGCDAGQGAAHAGGPQGPQKQCAAGCALLRDCDGLLEQQRPSEACEGTARSPASGLRPPPRAQGSLTAVAVPRGLGAL